MTARVKFSEKVTHIYIFIPSHMYIHGQNMSEKIIKLMELLESSCPYSIKES